MQEKKIVETPLMKQFFEVKRQHPDALLLFRVGDFYETFGDDAIIASKVLGILLTRRANGAAQFVELAGFPHHSIETYLPKLVSAGYKVAVCDQLEDPKLAKKIVKRGVTELVTPGIAYSDQLLNQKENNFLGAVYFSADKGGIAFLDISTGTFKVTEGSLDYIEVLLSNFAPKEVLVQKGYQQGFKERFGTNFYISTIDEWAFAPDACTDKLQKQFGLNSLKGFGVENLKLGTTAAGAILFYLEHSQNTGVAHLCSISRIDKSSFVWMDKFTFRNLEIFQSTAGKEGVALIDVIDKCASPLGSRLLRNWLAMPLLNIDAIKERHSIVNEFVNNKEEREEIENYFSKLGDLERIISKAAAGKITPREVMQLKRGLEQMEPIKEICGKICLVKKGKSIGEEVNPLEALKDEVIIFDELHSEIEKTIMPEPAAFGKGDVIADGVNDELDQLREIARHGKDYLLEVQQRESERTGIPSLRISYNNVFGYYLEVRNTHKHKVPKEWIRKQTLVSAERYITKELKDYEEKILGAEDRINSIELQIYQQVVATIQKFIPQIQQSCNALAKIDCLQGFAKLAIENKYCLPIVNDSLSINIKQGRHPVIETLMQPGEEYVANDIFLDNNSQQIIILTGPNMSGKSALLRQTALIVLLAQIGSFVPAQSAEIGFTDKIFTRVGASDNISKGESTFMVEMTETSTILHNLSQRSLILLDEIGRGTSTFDGMSIAWAIVEYIHQGKAQSKTLFATHYHELNDLENIYPRVKNFHIAVKEVDKSVIFLRKLCEGGVAHSFGIHVARMAGMPIEVVESAQRTLKKLEKQSGREVKGGGEVKGERENHKVKGDNNLQLSFFQLEDPLLCDLRDTIKEMDINSMSPLDAFDALRNLKEKLGLKR